MNDVTDSEGNDMTDSEGDADPQTFKTIAIIHEQPKITKHTKTRNMKGPAADDMERTEMDPNQTVGQIKRPVQMTQRLHVLQEQIEFLSQINTNEVSDASATQHQSAAAFSVTRRSPASLLERHANATELANKAVSSKNEKPLQLAENFNIEGREYEFSSNTVSFTSSLCSV